MIKLYANSLSVLFGDRIPLALELPLALVLPPLLVVPVKLLLKTLTYPTSK